MGMSLRKGQKIARGTMVVKVPAICFTEDGQEIVKKFKTSSARLEAYQVLVAREKLGEVSNIYMGYVAR